MTESRSPDHFKRIYDAGPDPWNFETSAYEQGKYRDTLAVLGDQRFTSGLEVGCSIGVLTRMLAGRCETILGVDLLEAPLVMARERCAGQPSIRFDSMQVPQSWPDGRFDLIVFSEVLYFLNRHDIAHCATHAQHCLLPGGTILLVNWLGKSDDPCSGEEAANAFIESSAEWLHRVVSRRNPGYRIDVLIR